MMSMESKLTKLRDLMRGSGSSVLPKGVTSLGAYVVPSEDAHQSEYTAEQHKRRQFISGFTGSAGTAVVTLDKALLWTDGRYFLQAERELDAKHWQLMKIGSATTPTIQRWLSDNCERNSYVGIDPTLLSQDSWVKWSGEMERKQVQLVGVQQNLVDLVWDSCEETRTGSEGGAPVYVYPVKYSGETWQSKVERVKKEMESEKADLLVVSELDEIAWLFNLRGADIDFNPVFFAYAIISANHIPAIFIDQSKLTPEIKQHLEGVEIKPYESVFDSLETMVAECVEKKTNVWMGPQVSRALAVKVTEKDKNLLLIKNTPTKQLKAVKNECELEWMRSVHVKDGVALCEYLKLLEDKVSSSLAESGEQLTEISAAAILDGLRAKQEDFIGLSFPTISGSGPNGAVIHYQANAQTDRKLSPGDLYLVDSGGQYWGGTTDVTRTVTLLPPSASSPPPKQMECYTLVLKGHIALAELVIPVGTLGFKIDSAARSALWSVGLDYLHGTGHGVGACLNVHEGPQSISWRTNPHEEGLKENVIMSNEPGYYEAGEFGIRLESLIVFKKHKTKYTTEGKDFLKPETITYVPLDRKLIDKSLLSSDEVKWVDEYHQLCWDKLSPLMEKLGKNELIEWLKKQTSPL